MFLKLRKQLHLSSLPFVGKVWNEEDRQEVNLLVKTPSSAHYYTCALRRYNELQLIQWRKQQQFYLSVHEQKDDKRKLKKLSLKTPLIWSRAWQHPCVQVDYLKVTITMFGFVLVTATATQVTSSYTREQRSRFVSLLCLNWWRKPKSETLHPLEKRTKLSERNKEVAKLDGSCWISSKLLCVPRSTAVSWEPAI